jgi:sulfur-oxidizing protein SoxY
MNWQRILVLPALLGTLALVPAIARADPFGGDPLGSHQWPVMQKDFLGPNARVSFDARIKVTGPKFAEDAMNVPVTVDARAVPDIDRILVLVDRNPIRKVLEFQPASIPPVLSFRFRLEQGSPVRVAVLSRDGQWRVGSTFIDAAGGGCTVSGASRADGSWDKTLGQVQGRVFPRDDLGAARLRVRVMHPMDTGLVSGVPAFYLRNLVLSDASGGVLARLMTFEPVSENPVFSFDLPETARGPFRLSGLDNNGNKVAAELAR